MHKGFDSDYGDTTNGELYNTKCIRLYGRTNENSKTHTKKKMYQKLPDYAVVNRINVGLVFVLRTEHMCNR